MADKKNFYHLWLGMDERVPRPNLFQILGIDPRSRDNAAIKAKAGRAAKALFDKLQAVEPKSPAEDLEKEKMHEKIVAAYNTISSQTKRVEYLRGHAKKAAKAGLVPNSKIPNRKNTGKNTAPPARKTAPQPEAPAPTALPPRTEAQPSAPAATAPPAPAPAAPWPATSESVPPPAETNQPAPWPASAEPTAPNPAMNNPAPGNQANPNQVPIQTPPAPVAPTPTNSAPPAAVPAEIPTAIPLALPVNMTAPAQPQYQQPAQPAPHAGYQQPYGQPQQYAQQFPQQHPQQYPQQNPIANSPQQPGMFAPAQPSNSFAVENDTPQPSVSVRVKKRSRKRGFLVPVIMLLCVITCVGGLLLLISNYHLFESAEQPATDTRTEVVVDDIDDGDADDEAMSRKEKRRRKRDRPNSGEPITPSGDASGMVGNRTEDMQVAKSDTPKPIEMGSEMKPNDAMSPTAKPFKISDFAANIDDAPEPSETPEPQQTPEMAADTTKPAGDTSTPNDGSTSMEESSQDPSKQMAAADDESNPFDLDDGVGDPFGVDTDPFDTPDTTPEVQPTVTTSKPSLAEQLAIRDTLGGLPPDPNRPVPTTEQQMPNVQTVTLTDDQLTAIRMAHYRSADALLRNDLEKARFFNEEAIKVMSLVNAFSPEEVASQQRPLVSVVTNMPQMIGWVENFWNEVKQSAVQMGGGTEVIVGDNIMSLVEGRSGDVILRISGQNVTFEYKDLTPVLAITIGELGSKSDVPQWNLSKAAFLAVMEEQNDKLEAMKNDLLQQSISDGFDLESDVIKGYASRNWEPLGQPNSKIAPLADAKYDELIKLIRESLNYKSPNQASTARIPELIHRLTVHPLPDLELHVACLWEAVALIEKSGRVFDLSYINRELVNTCTSVDFDRSFVDPILKIAGKNKASLKKQDDVAREIISFLNRFGDNPSLQPKSRSRLVNEVKGIAQNLNDRQLAAMANRLSSER